MKKHAPRIVLSLLGLLIISIGVSNWELIMETISDEGIMPRSMCWMVKPYLLPFNFGGHAIVAVSYFAISSQLLLLAYRRGKKTLTYETVVYGLFILFCGLSHVTALLMFYWGIATIDTINLDITAIISFLAMVRTFKVRKRLEMMPTLEEAEDAQAQLAKALDELKNVKTVDPQKIEELNSGARGLLEIVERYKQSEIIHETA